MKSHWVHEIKMVFRQPVLIIRKHSIFKAPLPLISCLACQMNAGLTNISTPERGKMMTLTNLLQITTDLQLGTVENEYGFLAIVNVARRTPALYLYCAKSIIMKISGEYYLENL